MFKKHNPTCLIYSTFKKHVTKNTHIFLFGLIMFVVTRDLFHAKV